MHDKWKQTPYLIWFLTRCDSKLSTGNEVLKTSVISFLTERHKRQREIILKIMIPDSSKRRYTKKKNENLQDTGLDLEEVTYGGPTF